MGRENGQALLGLRRLELGLARIRWFAVAFGLFQTWQVAISPQAQPSYVIPLTLALLGVLAVGNLVITRLASRTTASRTLRLIGFGAFGLDVAVVVAVSWIYSYDPGDTTWVLMYVLPMEGALRYQLRGAVATIALALVSELAREAYVDALSPRYEFMLQAATFRVGVLAIIALVAGVMARSLALRAAEADQRARALEELAAREAEGRRELATFHETVLAGVAGRDPEQALQSMAEAITRHLGYDGLAIYMVENGRVRCRAARGLAARLAGTTGTLGEGLVGRVAETGHAELVGGSRSGIQELPRGATGAMASPMHVGGLLIGVIVTYTRESERFDADALRSFTRLAGQVALVALQAVLLAERDETVRRLQELDRMRSEFVAITSHELRTPITAIRGFVRTLTHQLDRLSSVEAKDFLDIIDSQSERLARLVNDLLVVSRVEARRLELQIRDVEVAPFLRRVASFFDGGGRIELRLPDQPIISRFDPDRVEQVLHNLLENAVKFSPPDAPVVLGAEKPGNALEFTVVDRGAGIPTEELSRIFERFHQVGDPMTREQNGVGLGLYISKRIVDEMGGEIRVSSEVGEGTTFRVRLPHRPAPEPVL
ncbi:MAG TPA: ATP-binding protein [Actinomycetota bacterium]|nr:ATP-binding protein [Actinomycetota bacterium]